SAAVPPRHLEPGTRLPALLDRELEFIVRECGPRVGVQILLARDERDVRADRERSQPGQGEQAAQAAQIAFEAEPKTERNPAAEEVPIAKIRGDAERGLGLIEGRLVLVGQGDAIAEEIAAGLL